MKNKRLVAILLAVILVTAVLAACNSAPGDAASQSAESTSAETATTSTQAQGASESGSDFQLPTNTLSLVAGPTGGTFLIVAAGAAEIYSQNGVQVDALNGGGAQNIISVSRGEADMGITYLTTMPLAMEGVGDFTEKYENVSVLTVIAPNLEQVLALSETGISTYPDLKGQKFGGSLIGQGSQIILNEVLGVYGMSEDDLVMTRGSQTECAELMKDKQVVAWGACTGCPSATIMDIATTRDVTFIGMTDEEMATLIETNNGYAPGVIPAGTYKGQDEDVQVPCSYTVLIVNNDMDEDLAYWLTKTLAENLEAYRQTHDSLSGLTVEMMANAGQMPIHPGAQRYYDEVLK